MASFEARIEGMTQIAIEESDSAPTQAQVTQFLDEGIKDLTNKVINIRPDESYKFAAESESANDTGVTVIGKILSVMREHDSTSILRPCSPMPAELKYLATDTNSLHYRSKYNPGYFVTNKKVFVRPAAAGSDNDMKVSQVSYATTNFNQDAISDFPDEYEDLISLYASAQSCLSAASNIQNNMPSVPVSPSISDNPTLPDAISPPNITVAGVSLPSPPLYIPPGLDFDLGQVKFALTNEDIEMAEKEMELVDKRIERFRLDKENAIARYQESLDIFNADLDRLTKNADRESQVIVARYKSEIDKFTADISRYQQQVATNVQDFTQKVGRYQQEVQSFAAELQEKVQKYQWYQGQYVNFMNQYNAGISSVASKPAQEKQREG